MTPPGVNPGEEGERDVVWLPSGLSYADVELGRGEPLKVADLVVAHVVGPSRTVPSSRTRTGEARRSLSPSACARRACARAWRGHREHARGRAATHRRPAVAPVRERSRAPLGRVPAGAALRYEVQLLGCLPAGEGGTGGREICCTDEKYPCDPLRAVEEGEQRRRRLRLSGKMRERCVGVCAVS